MGIVSQLTADLLTGKRVNTTVTLDTIGVAWLLKTASIERTLPYLRPGMGARKFALKLAELISKPSTYKIPKTFDRTEFLSTIAHNLPEMEPKARLVMTRYGHELIPEGTTANISATKQKWIEPDVQSDFMLSLVENLPFHVIANKHYCDGPELFKFLWDAVPSKNTKITNELCQQGKTLQDGGILPTGTTDKYGPILIQSFPQINTRAFLFNAYRFMAWETFQHGWELMYKNDKNEAQSISKQILCRNTKCIPHMPSCFYKGALEAFRREPPELAQAQCLGGANLLVKGLIEVKEAEQYLDNVYKLPEWEPRNPKIIEFSMRTIERAKTLADTKETPEIDLF